MGQVAAWSPGALEPTLDLPKALGIWSFVTFDPMKTAQNHRQSVEGESVERGSVERGALVRRSNALTLYAPTLVGSGGTRLRRPRAGHWLPSSKTRNLPTQFAQRLDRKPVVKTQKIVRRSPGGTVLAFPCFRVLSAVTETM